MKVKNQYQICKFCKAKIYTPYKLHICPVCRRKQDTGEYIPHVRGENPTIDDYRMILAVMPPNIALQPKQIAKRVGMPTKQVRGMLAELRRYGAIKLRATEGYVRSGAIKLNPNLKTDSIPDLYRKLDELENEIDIIKGHRYPEVWLIASKTKQQKTIITELKRRGEPLDNPNLKLAKEMRSRYSEDKKAGHLGAAEYWRGQAAAYFTGNPKAKRLGTFYDKDTIQFVSHHNQMLRDMVIDYQGPKSKYRGTGKYYYVINFADLPESWVISYRYKKNNPVCYLCHKPFTTKYRRPIKALHNGNPVSICGVCARKLVRTNPLAGLFTSVGEAAISGVGLGIGFGAVEYARKQLSRKGK